MDEDDLIEKTSANKQVSDSEANQPQMVTPIKSSITNEKGASMTHDIDSAHRNLIENETDLKYTRKNSNENVVELAQIDESPVENSSALSLKLLEKALLDLDTKETGVINQSTKKYMTCYKVPDDVKEFYSDKESTEH